jgi:hypothetical protein
MNSERDLDAIQTWEHDSGYAGRATGQRRERPGVCQVCGDDMPDRPWFGDSTCGRNECRDQAVRR